MRDRGLTQKDEIVVETLGGLIRPRLEPDGEVSVNMDVPRFEPREVPFEAPARVPLYDLDVDGQTVPVSVLSMGNPHAVQLVPDVDLAPVNTQGAKIERHPRFPKRVNADYMQVVDRRTSACACTSAASAKRSPVAAALYAAVVAGRQRGLLDDTVKVTLPGGTLTVSWAGEGKPVRLAGPAVAVFEGTLDLDGL